MRNSILAISFISSSSLIAMTWSHSYEGKCNQSSKEILSILTDYPKYGPELEYPITGIIKVEKIDPTEDEDFHYTWTHSRTPVLDYFSVSKVQITQIDDTTKMVSETIDNDQGKQLAKENGKNFRAALSGKTTWTFTETKDQSTDIKYESELTGGYYYSFLSSSIEAGLKQYREEIFSIICPEKS